MAFCANCDNYFEKNHPARKYCVACSEVIHKEQLLQARKKCRCIKRYKTNGLENAEKEINLYNKLHKTNYSYGYYIAYKRLGLIF